MSHNLQAWVSDPLQSHCRAAHADVSLHRISLQTREASHRCWDNRGEHPLHWSLLQILIQVECLQIIKKMKNILVDIYLVDSFLFFKANYILNICYGYSYHTWLLTVNLFSIFAQNLHDICTEIGETLRHHCPDVATFYAQSFRGNNREQKYLGISSNWIF